MSKKKSKHNNKEFNRDNSMNRETKGDNAEVNYIYRKNINALKFRYPQLAELVSNTEISGKYRLIRAKAEYPATLLVPDNNLFYYEPQDPLKDVVKQISELHLKNTRIALFLGFGLGYELVHYTRVISGQQKTNHILVIEKDPEIFKLALMNMDLVPYLINDRVHFIVGVKAEELFPRFVDFFDQQQRYLFIKAMRMVYHPSALRLNKEYYLQVIKVLREACTYQILKFGDSPQDSLVGIENMLANIGEIASNPGINQLFNKFKDRPAVIVATGPSLNKNKHLLKGLEDKALVIAADASLRVLVNMDFKPHMVVSLERDEPIIKLFEGFKPEEVQDVYLAGCPVLKNEVYQAYPGPRIIVYRNFDHFKWLGIEKGILDIKLSSGNMAFKVAEALGCDPIILIGQDLAFSRDGKTHAQGMVYGEVDNNHINDQHLEVIGNDGQPITTTRGWYSFLKAYEIDVAGYAGRCINSTEGGAYIQGTQVMPFQDAIDTYITESFFPLQIIKECLSQFTPSQQRSDTRHLLELFISTEKDIRDIIADCRNGVETYEKYGERLQECLADSQKLDSIRNQLPLIEAEMKKPQQRCLQRQQTFQLFMAHVFQSYHIQFLMNLVTLPEKYDDDDMVGVESILRLAEWYATIGDIAGICLQRLMVGKETLNMV